MIGNPCHTNAWVISKYASKIPKENISGLSYLDHNRGLSRITELLNLKSGEIRNVIIWGNHSPAMHPDFSQVEKTNGEKVQIPQELDDLIQNVKHRGTEILRIRGITAAYSTTHAILDHMKKWIFGTEEGEIVSMGMFSPKGNKYGIPEDVLMSIPVSCSDGKCSLYENLEVMFF